MITKSSLNALCTGLCLLSLVLFPSVVESAEAGQGKGAVAIEEVVVTARRREESLQTVPIAVTAFQGERLQRMDINDISAFSDLAPNVTLKPTASLSGASNAAAFFIRGIGQTDFAVTTDPGVGTYLDDVYIARSIGGVLDTLDVESVEVLRGPQGTLFGRNTIGGAINIRSRRPGDDFSGDIRATTGTRDRRDLAAAIDVPLSDRLKTRFSLLTQNQQGYVKRLVGLDNGGRLVPSGSKANASALSDRQGNRNNATFRLAVEYQPTDALNFHLTVDETTVDEQSAASTAAISSGGIPLPGAPPLVVLPPINVPGLGAVSPGDPRLIIADKDTTYATGPNGTELDISGAALTATWNFSDALEFKSITARRATEGSFNRDGDGTPFPIGEQTRVIDFEQFSQEFQLVGNAENLDWTLGLYYFEEQARDRVLVSLGNLFGPPPGIDIDNAVDNESLAVFGQATWRLTDKLSATGGIRWTEDDKSYRTSQVIPVIPLTVVNGASSEKFAAVTGRLGVEFQATESSLLYVAASRGFKSGGFTPRYVAPVAAPTAFAEETVESLELGWKWRAWDDRAQVNTALFTSRYEDIQLVLFDTFGAPINQNGGDATISGLELEAVVVFNEYFRLNATAAYIDAGFDNVLPPNAASPFQPVTKDSKFPNTPEFQTSISPEFIYPVASGNVTLSVNWVYSDDVYQTFENDPELFQKSYNLLGAAIGYQNEAGNWSVTLGGHNLTDERIIISGGIGRVPGFGDVNYNRPREWYLSLRKGF